MGLPVYLTSCVIGHKLPLVIIFPQWTFNYNLIPPCLFYLPPSMWLLVTLSTPD